jgi:hypothetical protein
LTCLNWYGAHPGIVILLIKIAICHFDSSIFPLGITAVGAAAFLFIPGARKHIAKEHWSQLFAIGFVWMASLFFLYLLAEETFSSATMGMMNGGLLVVVTMIKAIWVRSVPNPFYD